MPDEAPFTVSLGTDFATGELEINFHPEEGHHSPLDIEDWPPLRKELREVVRNKIAGDEHWEAYLSSDRRGERLTVNIGTVRIKADGSYLGPAIAYEHPEDVSWEDN